MISLVATFGLWVLERRAAIGWLLTMLVLAAALVVLNARFITPHMIDAFVPHAEPSAQFKRWHGMSMLASTIEAALSFSLARGSAGCFQMDPQPRIHLLFRDIMSAPPQTPTLAVLAGGAGSRMGQPKALLRIDGRPILEFILNQTAWRGPTLLVTSPTCEHPPGCEAFDREVTDPVADQGPLRGLLTALQGCRTQRLILISVDMPQIADAQLAWLRLRLEQDSADVAGIMLRTSGPNTAAYRTLTKDLSPPLVLPPATSSVESGRDRKGASAPAKPPPPPSPGVPVAGEKLRRNLRGSQIEPFPSIWHIDAATRIEAMLDQGERSMQALAKQDWVQVLDTPGEWPAEIWTNLNNRQDLQSWLKRSSRAGG